MNPEGEGEGGMIWENGIETCILSCKNQIASLCPMQDTACLGLVHGDDLERCYGEGGGRGFMFGDFYFKGFNVQVKLRTLGVVETLEREKYRGAKGAWS